MEDFLLDDSHDLISARRPYLDDSDSEEEEKEGDIQDKPVEQGHASKCETCFGQPIYRAYDGEKVVLELRVVRNPTKESKSKTVELGSIVDIPGRGKVKVQWDTQDEKSCENDLDMKEVLLYDNAQIGVKHHNIACSACYEYPLRGIRWKCLKCSNYDLCTDCYMGDVHDLKHSFERIQSNKSKGIEVPPREDSTWFECSGILKYSKVSLRRQCQYSGIGTVINLSHKKVNAFMCDAVVKMEGNQISRRFCVGREGKSELSFTKEGAGISYYEDHLPVMRSEYCKAGIRVVRGSPDEDGNVVDKGKRCVGTIVRVDEKKEESNQSKGDKRKSAIKETTVVKTMITVQWDNGQTNEHEIKNDESSDLRIFDNRQIGIEHLACCDECCEEDDEKLLQGIRWICDECDNYDLCTDCYMSDKHNDKNHTFSRKIEPNAEREKIKEPRSGSKTQSYGIFKNAVVQKAQVHEAGKRCSKHKESGKVEDIRDCKINIGRSDVVVKWQGSETQPEKRSFVELKCAGQADYPHYLYPDHLPVLGNDTRGYIDVKFGDSEKKIEVNLWYKTEMEDVPSFKPMLYLIFANHPEFENEQNKSDLLQEIIDFSKRSSCYCHLVGAKILLHHHVSEGKNEVFIHQKTDHKVVEELVQRGYKTFHRGDTDENIEEIDYFLRMAKLCSGENMLPVIVSLRNGGLRRAILHAVVKSKIPIVLFRRQSYDAFILTAKSKSRFSVQMTKYTGNLKMPGKIISDQCEEYDIGGFDRKDNPDEIASIADISYEAENLEAHICHLLLGVAVKARNLANVFGKDTKIYIEALSVHLLKEGKWKLPKETIQIPFSQRAIEFIFEKDMTSDFKEGLWKELQDRSGRAYNYPTLEKKKDNSQSDDNFDDEIYMPFQFSFPSPKTDDENDDGIFDITNVESKKNKEGKGEQELKLNAKSWEMYGLLFYALLKEKYYFGAKQLIETGFIRIPQIFVGCVILNDAADDWKTSNAQKENLIKMNKILTEQAIRITSCIHDEDKKQEKDEKKKDKDNQIFHTGRLLLNHGYLENAIKTQNRTFLYNNTIRKILNKMWYGEEEMSLHRKCVFAMLALFHPIMLPILMITIANTPLKRFYDLYNLPFMKVLINSIGFVILLIVYAYMLLFEYSDSLSFWDYIIIGWMSSFFLDENKQHIVAIRRKKWKCYISDLWNRLDWLLMITYASGMFCKLGTDSKYKDAARALLVFTFMMLCIRILNMFCMSEKLGPKLVSIRKMFADTVAFMVIMTVIMICFNVSSYALLYPNSDFTFSTLERIMSNGYWMLFGELNLETWNLAEPECSFNSTIFQSGELPRCPSRLGIMIAPTLKVVYGIIAVILMLNLLIAMYSDTYQKVHMESEFYWSELQIDFLEEYSVKSVFPIHMQSLALVALIGHSLFPCIYLSLCDGMSEDFEDSETEDNKTLQKHPIFVRAFFYDTTFDLRLKKTDEAEETGALKAKGEMEVSKKDKLAMLQKLIENQGKKQNDKNNDRHKETMTKLKKLKTGLDEMAKEIAAIASKVCDDHDHQILELDTEWYEASEESEESDYEDDLDENVFRLDD